MHKRVIGAMAISGVAALALSACGGSSTPSTPGPAPSAGGTKAAAVPTPSSTTDAPVRDANVDLVIWSEANPAPGIKKIADAFGKEQGITTSVQIAVNARQQYKDATKVGKGPDIVVGAHDWLGELVQENTVAPIQLSADTAAQFAKTSIDAAKFNGQNYGVPYAVENIALMRNTALAPDAPKTMDELVASGKAIKAKNPKVTNVLLQQVGKTGNAYYTYPYMSAFGGGIFGSTADGGFDPNKVIVGSKGSVQGAEVLAKLGKEGILSTNVGDDNAEGLFDAGKSPYFFTG
ncbi:MAG: extracellular solute-binding protein, partial [Terracoccus sp.]